MEVKEVPAIPLCFTPFLPYFSKARIYQFMYFDDYKDFPDPALNPKLLWEYRLSEFNFQEMRDVVVQRVIERGWPNDWYFILNFYGIVGVKEAIKNIAYLNDKDLNFVSHQFNIQLTSMKCYKKKQSAQQHWNA